MISLGIDSNGNLVFEGDTGSGLLVQPTPVMTAATFVDSKTEQLAGAKTRDLYSVPLVFREDEFDPVSRVRRGRFYERNQSQPIRWQVYAGILANAGLRELATFHSCAVSGKYLKGREGQPLVVLGYAEQFTVWTVVSIELSVTGEEVVALRSRAAIGALPEVRWNRIPEEGKAQVKKTLEILAEDIYRAGPESVIDRARDAASAILGAYLVDKGRGNLMQDLGKIVKALNDIPGDERLNICMNGGDIIRILHPRAKPSEQARRLLRPIREQDAELAVQLIGTMLCDLRWAEWR